MLRENSMLVARSLRSTPRGRRVVSRWSHAMTGVIVLFGDRYMESVWIAHFYFEQVELVFAHLCFEQVDVRRSARTSFIGALE